MIEIQVHIWICNEFSRITVFLLFLPKLVGFQINPNKQLVVFMVFGNFGFHFYVSDCCCFEFRLLLR